MQLFSLAKWIHSLELLLIWLLLLLLLLLLLGECAKGVLTHSHRVGHEWVTLAASGRHATLHHGSEGVLSRHHLLLLHHGRLVLLLLLCHHHLLIRHGVLLMAHRVRNELWGLLCLWLLLLYGSLSAEWIVSRRLMDRLLLGLRWLLRKRCRYLIKREDVDLCCRLGLIF